MSDEDNRNVELPTGDINEDENPDAANEVPLDNELKRWFIDYVGKKKQPEDGVVTVAMVVSVFVEEFPEFLMVVAEENWIRGYRQGVADSDEGVRLALEQAGLQGHKVVVPPPAQDKKETPSDSE